MAGRLDISIHKWATDLTLQHKVFSLNQPLTPQHFSCLTKDERLQPIFTYLIRHIRRPEEQRHIKLNLKNSQLRKKLAGSDHELSTSEERFKLHSEIFDAKTAISSEVAEIQQLSQRKEELRQKEIEMERRFALLEVVSEEYKKEARRFKSYNAELPTLLGDASTSAEKCSNPSVVRPAVQKLLQSNLLDIGNLRHSVVAGELQDRIHEEKCLLWEHVREILQDWGPRELLTGILGEAREGTRNLRSLVQRVDLARDAHELRVKCEKDGSFIDEMNPGGVIESVRELLGTMNATHVKLYLEAHHANETAASLGRVLNTLTNNITTAVKRNYEDDVAPAVINLVKENISLAGERAALNATHTLSASLEERSEIAARAREALSSKFAKITSFNKEVQAGVETIHCLALCVEKSSERIENQMETLRTDIENSLKSMTFPTPVAQDALSKECESFARVPLSYLLTTNLDEFGLQRKADLTTSSLVWHDKTLLESGWSALATLGSGQLCWDGVFKRVVDRINHIVSLRKQMEQLTNLKASASAQKKKMLTTKEANELIEAAEKTDKEMEEELKKLASHFEKQIIEGFQYVGRANRAMSEWWEQPAKKAILKPLD